MRTCVCVCVCVCVYVCTYMRVLVHLSKHNHYKVLNTFVLDSLVIYYLLYLIVLIYNASSCT